MRVFQSIIFYSKTMFQNIVAWIKEVGGSGKGFDQIKDIPDSFVAADDIETGFGNKIPLWLFGFLY